MEKQTIEIVIQTKGDVCELSDEEIKAWYEANVAKLFNPAYGTPEISVRVTREKTND